MQNHEELREYDDILSPDDVMQVLKIGRNSLYSLLKSGEIPGIMLAGKYRIPKKELIEYIHNTCSRKNVSSHETKMKNKETRGHHYGKES